MKFRRKQKITPRFAKPSVGRSLSTNSYYRPKARPVQNLKAEKKSETNKPKGPVLNWLNPSNIINLVIVLGFVVMMFFATTLSSSPDVKISANSYHYRDKSEYSEVATDILNESLLNKSKLFFKSTNFEEKMQLNFPEISYVEAIVPLGGRDLTVSMQLSTPLARISNGSSKGVVDSNGVLITDSVLKNAQSLFNLRFTTPQENFKVGSSLLTSSEVDLLALLSSELASLNVIGLEGGLTIKEALFNVSDGQFEVSFNEVSYLIKLSSYADASEQVGSAKVTIKELVETNQPPSKYLDVRVPGRVFVL